MFVSDHMVEGNGIKEACTVSTHACILHRRTIPVFLADGCRLGTLRHATCLQLEQHVLEGPEPEWRSGNMSATCRADLLPAALSDLLLIIPLVLVVGRNRKPRH